MNAVAPPQVDTRTARRRDVRYRSLADVSSDLDRIEAAHDAGTLTTNGNWTAGQALQHCSILMRCAIDGFPSRAPAPVRLLITMLYKKKALSGQPMPPGYKIPKQAPFLQPDEHVSFEKGMSQMRDVLARLKAGAQFNQPSPIFGSLTHEEWVKFQLGHCQLHMSFLDLGR